jgi:hypothetical protein
VNHIDPTGTQSTRSQNDERKYPSIPKKLEELGFVPTDDNESKISKGNKNSENNQEDKKTLKFKNRSKKDPNRSRNSNSEQSDRTPKEKYEYQKEFYNKHIPEENNIGHSTPSSRNSEKSSSSNESERGGPDNDRSVTKSAVRPPEGGDAGQSNDGRSQNQFDWVESLQAGGFAGSVQGLIGSIFAMKNLNPYSNGSVSSSLFNSFDAETRAMLVSAQGSMESQWSRVTTIGRLLLKNPRTMTWQRLGRVARGAWGSMRGTVKQFGGTIASKLHGAGGLMTGLNVFGGIVGGITQYWDSPLSSGSDRAISGGITTTSLIALGASPGTGLTTGIGGVIDFVSKQTTGTSVGTVGLVRATADSLSAELSSNSAVDQMETNMKGLKGGYGWITQQISELNASLRTRFNLRHNYNFN